MEDKALLEAIRAIVQEENKPIKEELHELNQRLLKVEITQENVTNRNIKLLMEDTSQINLKLDRFGRLDAKVEDHGNRIWALEQAVKAK